MVPFGSDVGTNPILMLPDDDGRASSCEHATTAAVGSLSLHAARMRTHWVRREVWSATSLPYARTRSGSQMSDTFRLRLALLVTAVVGVSAVLSNRLTERLRVPAPALMLVAAAIAVQLIACCARSAGRDGGAARHGRACAASCSTAACTSVGRSSAPPPRRSSSSACVGTFLTDGRSRALRCTTCSVSTGTPRCWSRRRWRRRIRPWCSPCSASARSLAAAAPSSRVSPARTTRSASH